LNFKPGGDALPDAYYQNVMHYSARASAENFPEGGGGNGKKTKN